nr:unnamed protein product [Digitaria exilis]
MTSHRPRGTSVTSASRSPCSRSWLRERGIVQPMLIQVQGLPVLLSGRDMIGISFTAEGRLSWWRCRHEHHPAELTHKAAGMGALLLSVKAAAASVVHRGEADRLRDAACALELDDREFEMNKESCWPFSVLLSFVLLMFCSLFPWVLDF